MNRMRFKTAGWIGEDELWFEPGISECGHITDGVSIGHNHDAGFVLDFKDLERMYDIARGLRASLSGSVQCPKT